MLSSDYFDGSRELKLKEIVDNYNKFRLPIVSSDNKLDLMRSKLLINVSVFDMISTRYPEYLKYLLPWTRDSRCIERKLVYRYQFPLVNFAATEFTDTYELDLRILSLFWYARMYTTNPDFRTFDSLVDIGGAGFMLEVPPSRETIRDGQLKIVMDAVFAVDALSRKDGLRILVIGSSSPGVSGLAYNLIGHMITNSEIFLYDPVNVKTVFSFNTNVYHYIDEPYGYDEDCSIYDLVLDDSWVEHSTRAERDPFGRVYSCSNYSIKCFPSEDLPVDVNRYYQAFKTDSHEFRAVSRSIVYDFKSIPVGHCSACTELRYLLKDSYCMDFYLQFVSYHKVNCMTGEYRDDIDPHAFDYGFVKVNNVTEDFIDQCFKLPWDSGISGSVIPMNQHMISGAVIKISSERFLTNFVFRHALAILKIENGAMHFCGDPVKYGLFAGSVDPPYFPVKTVKSYNLFQEKQKQTSSASTSLSSSSDIKNSKYTRKANPGSELLTRNEKRDKRMMAKKESVYKKNFDSAWCYFG